MLPLATTSLTAALAVALQEHKDLHETWVRGSHRLAAAADLPMLIHHLQSLGVEDILLRQLGRELHPAAAADIAIDTRILASDYMAFQSRDWVFAAFEVVRTLRERLEDREDGRLSELYRRLQLVRVPLAKFQIAQDRVLGKDGSIELVRRGDPDEARGVTYKSGGGVPYIAQTLYDPDTGDIGWEAVDLKLQQHAQVMRTSLAEELLVLALAPPPRKAVESSPAPAPCDSPQPVCGGD